MGLCPDCDGEGRTLVTFGALRLTPRDNAATVALPSTNRASASPLETARTMETVALRECAVCRGAGWFESGRGH